MHEGDDFADADDGLLDESSTDPDDEEGGARNGKLDDGHHGDYETRSEEVDASDFVVGAGEFVFFVFFVVEGADDAQAGEVFAGDLVELII